MMVAHGAPGLQIRVLGPLESWVDGKPLQADTRKAVAILALLAVEGRPFARDELAATFWPDADDEAARGSLRRTLSTLRSGLGDRWISVDRSRVALDPAGVWLDLAEVEGALTSDDLPALEAAARLIRGPFLAGFNLRDSPAFDDWRAARASGVERSLAALLDRLAALQAEHGELPAAVGTAMRRLELDPLDEPAQRRVIALLADVGDRTGAIRQYRTCAALLDRELGVAPLAETVALYEAIRDGSYAPPPRRTVPESLTAMPAVPFGTSPGQLLPFVGRERELAAVRARHRAGIQDGSVVVIEGEPGIGKTRLLQEIAGEAAGQGGVVLLARAWAAESGIAYAPVVELLRRSFEDAASVERLAALSDRVRTELGRLVNLPESLQPTRSGRGRDGLDPSLARGRLLDALATTLTTLLSGPVPGILGVDDLHLADASTLELVGWLLRRLEGRPILLVLTWCPEDLGDHALPVAALAEGDPTALVLRLRRLDRPAVAQLLAAMAQPGGAEALARESAIDALLDASEGLPIDLAERLAQGAGEPAEPASPGGLASPHGFRALLRDRLARVGETASQVLAAGAVIGRSFDLPTVRGASGRSEDETVAALDELIRRGLIRETEAGPELRFDFAHGSLRDTTYAGISLVRRRLLHARVADALRASLDRTGPAGASDLARLVLIAQHERDAGRTAEAAEAFRVAAGGARRVYANHEAIELVESAIALGHSATPDLQRLLGELRLGLGEYVAAIAAFEAAAATAAGLDLAELELLLARAHARRADFATAHSHVDAGLLAVGETSRTQGAASEDHAGLQLAVRLLVERGVVALQAQEPGVAQEAASEALERASRLEDRTSEGRAYRILGLVARSRGDLPSARSALDRSLQLAASDPDPGAAIAAGNALALVELAAGDHQAAIAHLELAAAEARRIGERHLEAAIENNLADSFHAAGDPERSMAHLRSAVALFAEIGGRPSELEPGIWKLQSW